MPRTDFDETEEIKNKGAFDAEAPRIRFSLRDMIFPARLLDATDWRNDPLIAYSERRSRRPLRFVATRLFEIVLFALALACFVPVVMRGPIGHIAAIVFFPAFVFLLIRYHLFVNDQSMFIKALARNRLEELMLTRLGKNDFFLHQFLMFCRSYRTVFGFLILTLLFAIACIPGVKVRIAGATFFMPRLPGFITLLMLFAIMFQVWIAGVYQFLLEWKWFAGGRLSRMRGVLSMAISVALTAMILAIDYMIASTIRAEISALENFFSAQVVFGAIWIIACGLVYVQGCRIHADAMERLRNRLDPLFSREPFTLKARDFILPWRWFGASEEARSSVRLWTKLQILAKSLVYGLLLAMLVYIALRNSNVVTIRWSEFFAYAGYLAGPAFCLFVVGSYHGQVIASEERPIAQSRLKPMLMWLGMLAIGVDVAVCYFEIRAFHLYWRYQEYPRFSEITALIRYFEYITFGVASIACGVLVEMRCGTTAHRLMLIGAMAILYIVMKSILEPGRNWLVSMFVALSLYLVAFCAARAVLEPLWVTKGDKEKG